MTAGRTKNGALGRLISSTAATVKPAYLIVSSVGRLHSQHTTSQFSPAEQLAATTDAIQKARS